VLARQSAIQQARIDHWRSLPHHLSTPSVDWSPRANRRVGWRAPAQPMRNPHEPDPLKGPAALARALADTVAPPDTIRLALIRIDFRSDRAGSETSGDGHFDLSGPDTTLAPIDRAPHDSAFYAAHLEALKRYYDAQSYGRVVVEGSVWPRNREGAYSVSDMADFGPWKFSREIYRDAVHMFRTMMFAADSQAVELGDPIPWDTFDRFLIVHAGSDFQSDLRGDSPLDIPSFTIGVSDTDVVVFPPDSTNRPIDRAAIVPETASQDGFYGALNGVIAHESGHNLFGMADLYNVVSGYPVVGLWSLMDSGNLTGSKILLPNGEETFATGLLPPSVDPFQRSFTTDILHFVEPAFGETTLVRASERYPDMRRIYMTSDEYLVFENRDIAPGDVIELDQDSTSRVILGPKTPDRFEYDALIPGPGLLVWHIDASVIPFETAFRVNPDYGYNSNPVRPGISVVEGRWSRRPRRPRISLVFPRQSARPVFQVQQPGARRFHGAADEAASRHPSAHARRCARRSRPHHAIRRAATLAAERLAGGHRLPAGRAAAARHRCRRRSRPRGVLGRWRERQSRQLRAVRAAQDRTGHQRFDRGLRASRSPAPAADGGGGDSGSRDSRTDARAFVLRGLDVRRRPGHHDRRRARVPARSSWRRASRLAGEIAGDRHHAAGDRRRLP
jgi:M6 family metalloprotease-like protein